ncbi:flp pilus-assembly TadE/G-like family protein [Nocardioides sp. CBS4Y-1]|uniref:Flp pilus-assembly TadE/G-like family protein n=1 Tax=Nocardioides acrostichi TaxID=2784339 RepID=A0A930V241_9ACTN|nr:flp pilus-assembly TadE/G-like family protein [Nocardioides acrostichi]
MRGRRAGPAHRGERGSAVPPAVAALGVLLVIGMALAQVGALVAAHRRSQAAADLAALAAASAAGGPDCRRATQIASANGATLESCEPHGREVLVDVVVAGPDWWGPEVSLHASARAGPA